jgi:predicted nucleic acid-binding protein
MAAPVYLLDTNVVLYLIRGGPVGEELASAFGLRDNVNRPLVSIVTHGERLLLAARNNWGARKQAALENALDNLVTVDLNDRAVLSAYVKVQQYSRQTAGGSRELKTNDAWIVACARAADATLLTTDQDFGHLVAPEWAVKVFDAASFSDGR